MPTSGFFTSLQAALVLANRCISSAEQSNSSSTAKLAALITDLESKLVDSQSTADDRIYTDDGARPQSSAGAFLAGGESRVDNRSAAVAAEGSAWGERRAAVASQQRWHIEQQLQLHAQVLYIGRFVALDPHIVLIL